MGPPFRRGDSIAPSRRWQSHRRLRPAPRLRPTIDALLRRLDRALVAAELAQHRTRDVDAAKFLDAVVGDAVLEHIAPGIGEGPEHGRHMGADRLAFRTRGALAGAAVELRAHGRVLDLGGVDVTDPWLRHRCFSVSSASNPEACTLYSPCLPSSFPRCPTPPIPSP